MHLCIDVSTVTMGHYQLPRARYAVHLVSLKQKEKKHWRNFTLKSGGDQWRHQDLVSGGGTTIEAPKGDVCNSPCNSPCVASPARKPTREA